MENFTTYSDVNNLLNLLQLNNDANSSDDEYEHISESFKSHLISDKTPANCIGAIKSNTKDNNNYKKIEKSKDIWSEDEVLDANCDEHQMKKAPNFDVVYQQKVTPDDLFLQLDGKGPGSTSCECLLMKIKLDGTFSKEEIDLKVSDCSLICKTEKYFLDFNFPLHVDPRQGSANWDQMTSTLVVKVFFDEEKKLDF